MRLFIVYTLCIRRNAGIANNQKQHRGYQMKKILTTTVSAALVMFLGFGTAIAQDEKSDEPKATPVETWTCDFNEGKGPADLEKVIAEWNDWMDDQGTTDYFAATITPNYFGERPFDIGWLGAWTDGNAMGAGTDLWINEGSDVAAKFWEVLTCGSHTNFVSINVKRLPENDDESDDSFVLTFSNCSMEEGKEYSEFTEAQKTWNAYADENGFVSSAWVFWPVFGESDNDYDFKYVTGTDDHTTLGANYQLSTEGHWRKSNELFSDLVDCDISRVYDAKVVREIESDDD